MYGSTLHEVQEKVKLTCADRSQTVVRGVPMQVSHCMGLGTRRTFYILIWVVGTVQKVTNLIHLRFICFTVYKVYLNLRKKVENERMHR